MMEKKLYDTYMTILKSELVTALGCTEPVAVAYASAKARQVLGRMPEKCVVSCSSNIVKNVKGVTVPNSGGLKGIEAAAVLGLVGGDPDRKLTILEAVSGEAREATRQLLQEDFCRCVLLEEVPGLYIVVALSAGDETTEVVIRDYHTNIVSIAKNGREIFTAEDKCWAEVNPGPDKALLNVRDILTFASEVEMKDIKEVISRQIEYNSIISREGLSRPYGVQVGRSLLADYGENDVRVRARAAAAAGSDARMSGCALPVVINSGSGNQGITVTMPVVEYAKEYGLEQEKLYRALVVSNLVAIHQKKYIGSLSAYCGVVSAACGSGTGIAYLLDYSYEEICDVITNTIATIGGMVCDGAKPSCAAKIAAAVDTAIMALGLSRKKLVFQPGEGLVKEDVEKTIASIGHMGREGMKTTDTEILRIMLEK